MIDDAYEAKYGIRHLGAPPGRRVRMDGVPEDRHALALLKRGMPTFFDFYQQAFSKPPSGPKHEALFLMNDISTKMQRGVFLPKGSPMEAARDLRQAFHAVERDKDFIEDFKKITGEEPELVRADEVERIFARIRSVDPEVKRVLRESVGAEQ